MPKNRLGKSEEPKTTRNQKRKLPKREEKGEKTGGVAGEFE